MVIRVRSYKNSMYWLARRGSGQATYDVQRDGVTFTVRGSSRGLIIRLNGKMVSASKEVVVKTAEGKELYRGKPRLSLRALFASMAGSMDLALTFEREITLP